MVKKFGPLEWATWADLFATYGWPVLKRLFLVLVPGAIAAGLKMWEHAQWSDVFLYGLWGIGGGLVVMLVTALLRKAVIAGTPQEQANEAAAIVATPSTRAAIDDFYRTYDNALLLEIEANIRAQANAYQGGNDRENFLVRSYATLGIIALFENMWLLIFGSQIRALHAVNAQARLETELRQFYEEATRGNPPLMNYPFDNWLGFMVSQLLIRQDGGIINVTLRGREFLKYLVETGKSAHERLL